ncbi:hypothetical protein B296_00017906 [Ensete ventricosum]|uniref:Uncharacterized protein n=1 Tax=Ensete ventricosum TaxID=4639 RepID=A0A426ZFW1_ENSVE|nr:hypothetical protein B296_00017906 [Ensete ventricosum]
MAGACRRTQRPRPCRKGWLPTARLQWVASRLRLSPTRVTAPVGAALAQGGTARWQLPTSTTCSTTACVGQRRQLRSEGKGRGLRHAFEKRMIIPL